jgi:hypothetical protein
MAAPAWLATGGYGTIYRNYGSEPRYLAEPDILTKFFAVGQPRDEHYKEERDKHNEIFRLLIQGTRRAPVNPTISHIIGIGEGTIVQERRNWMTVYPEPNRQPGNGNYFKEHGVYPVLKLPFLGKDFWGSYGGAGIGALRFNTFIRLFETFVLFHTSMIHNDMKMNNVLYNTALGYIAVIDLGESRTFVAGRNPWEHRDLGSYYFSYPPDLASGNPNYNKYRDYFSNIIAQGKIAEETQDGWNVRWKSLPNMPSMLDAVHRDFFANAAINSDKRNLWVGVTTDLYGVGVTLLHSIRDVPYNRKQAPIVIGYSTVDGSELFETFENIIKRLEVLLCHIHPRMRPLDYTLVMFFKRMNPDLDAATGPQTAIRVEGEGAYIDLSILAGVPANITVRDKMAYGKGRSPIRPADLEENMILFSYLITKDRLESINYFTQAPGGVYTKLQYANVLADARAYFANNVALHGQPNYVALGLVPGAAAPPPPQVLIPPRAARRHLEPVQLAPPPVVLPYPRLVLPPPPAAPPPAIAPPAAPLPPAIAPPAVAPPPALAPAPPGIGRRMLNYIIPRQVQPPMVPALASFARRQAEWHAGPRRGRMPTRGGVPADRMMLGAAINTVGGLVVAVPAGFIAATMRQMLGGQDNVLGATVVGIITFVQAVPQIDAMFSDYVYGAYNYLDAIRMLFLNQDGGGPSRGSVAVMRASRAQTQSKRSKSIRTQSKRHVTTKKMNSATNTSKAYPMLESNMYGKQQSDLITSQLISSEPSGVLNLLHRYYISQNKEIFKLLLQIPTYEYVPLIVIQELLDSQKYDELQAYLLEYIDNYNRVAQEGGFGGNSQLNSVGVALIAEYYYAFAEDDDRYNFLHNVYSHVPETLEDLNKIAQLFVNTPLGSNPYVNY